MDHIEWSSLIFVEYLYSDHNYSTISYYSTIFKYLNIAHPIIHYLVYPVGGLNPSEKYESLGMMKFPLYGKIKVMFQSPPTRLVIIEHRLSIDYP